MSVKPVDSSVIGLQEGGKARRVYLQLLDDISSGTYPDGSVLPGEQKLAGLLGVSRVTVRRALDALEVDGSRDHRAPDLV